MNRLEEMAGSFDRRCGQTPGRRRFGRMLRHVMGITFLVCTASSLVAGDAELRGVLAKAMSVPENNSSAAEKHSAEAPVAATAPVAAGSASPDLSTNAATRLNDKYHLAIGDRITFQVVEDRDEPKSIMVADSGDVEVPYLGPVAAKGKTCRELAMEIKTELERKYYYEATVVISVDAMLTRGMVYLVGAVRSPGPMEMPRNDVLTISKAVLRAGGFTDFADGKSVRVTRQSQSGTNVVFTMDVARILTKGKVEDDRPAESGDLIFVPEKTIRF